MRCSICVANKTCQVAAYCLSPCKECSAGELLVSLSILLSLYCTRLQSLVDSLEQVTSTDYVAICKTVYTPKLTFAKLIDCTGENYYLNINYCIMLSILECQQEKICRSRPVVNAQYWLYRGTRIHDVYGAVAVHCTWVTSSAYSSPSVVLASQNPDGYVCR